MCGNDVLCGSYCIKMRIIICAILLQMTYLILELHNMAAGILYFGLIVYVFYRLKLWQIKLKVICKLKRSRQKDIYAFCLSECYI